jgi:hypothetical protein
MSLCSGSEGNTVGKESSYSYFYEPFNSFIMKNFSFLVMLCFVGFSIGFIHSCKKDTASPSIPTTTPPDPVIATSFIEGFIDMNRLTETSGWVKKNNSANDNDNGLTSWGQGIWGIDKSGAEYGFPAYSDSALKDEYAFSGRSYVSISSWLITPVLSVKSGDKISFYTRSDPTGSFGDRLQVLMNKSTSTDVGPTLSAGSFTTTLIEINPAEEGAGYPTAWKKFEYTFINISGHINTRIAFRHYVVNPQNVTGIAIDEFRFDVK